jgi:hypothetical protein
MNMGELSVDDVISVDKTFSVGEIEEGRGTVIRTVVVAIAGSLSSGVAEAGA